jgi:hypothetical protein
MKKILAALFCVTLMGVPVLSQSCCAEKQQAQKQEQPKESCCAKQSAEKKVSQKESCDTKCAKQTAKASKDCTGCTQSAETWMTPPAKCKKGCTTASL